jgi:hypothetical protein
VAAVLNEAVAKVGEDAADAIVAHIEKSLDALVK